MKRLIKKIVRYILFDVLGEKAFFSIYRRTNRLINGYNTKKVLRDDITLTELRIKGKDVFFGYYDLNPFNEKQDKVLSMSIEKLSKKADIGYFDLNDNKFHKITETSSWNWQMGSRLRWVSDQNIIFNDFIDNEYCSRIVDLNGNEIKRLPYPLYDMDLNRNIGYFTDFTILHHLRRGYGYNNLNIDFDEYYNRAENGLFAYDIKSKKKITLFSIDQIIDIKYKNEFKNKYHYINHISVSKYDGKLMFFHIWTDYDLNQWKCRMMISDYKGKLINVIEDFDLVSHYTWLSENEILVTVLNGKTYEYRKYNIHSGEYKTLNGGILTRDGHPSINDKNIMISDTYPDKYSMQSLFYYVNEIDNDVICKLFSQPAAVGEFRCDLHPKVMGDLISIDTNLYGDRSQFIVNVKNLNFKKNNKVY